MKDILEILKDNGIEVEETKHKDIRRAVSEHYKTVNEFNIKVESLNGQLTTANDTITDLKGKLENAEKVDVKALQDRLKAFEDAEITRKQNETKAAELEALKARFTPLRKDKTFINEGTEKWIFDEFSKAIALEENKGKSDADIYDTITKDKNIYENPNQVYRSPKVGGSNSPKGDKAYMDEFYKGNPFYKN